MSKKSAEPIVHRDIFGKEIAVGDSVVYSQYNTLYVGFVSKLNTKMIRVSPVKSLGRDKGHLKYSHECMWVDGAQVTWYILKNSK